MSDAKTIIESGKAVLGIELGSTRIKAVLIDDNHAPIASGAFDWENRLEDGYWTYHQDEIWSGLQAAYADLAADVKNKYGAEITSLGAIGISAMMHGYMPFNEAGDLMVPFRTWRNTRQEQASEELTKLFNFHIPQRWSIAHLYQAILNKEEHVKDITLFTTLAGYIHWQLTGEKVLGVGEASGMFPIDTKTGQFDKKMMAQFDELLAGAYPWKLADIIPGVLNAGEAAGTLTAEGAKLLDASGKLAAGIPLCPPEGDAGTGMVATNAVTVRTGNVSAGTSAFSMAVLEKDLSKPYDEIDIVTTPTGKGVAMVHVNNCTSDLNKWVGLFKEFVAAAGIDMDVNQIFGTLYNKALEGDKDCDGLLAYNYFSGEHIPGFEEGRPLVTHKPDCNFNLANFMRSNIMTSLAVLKMGNDILLKENVVLDKVTGHGGLFKTPVVGQKLLSAALSCPVTVMETAGEGGAWGIALLAAFLVSKDNGESLEDYLEKKVFVGQSGSTLSADEDDIKGFDAFIENYKAGFAVERAAIDSLR